MLGTIIIPPLLIIFWVEKLIYVKHGGTVSRAAALLAN